MFFFQVFFSFFFLRRHPSFFAETTVIFRADYGADVTLSLELLEARHLIDVVLHFRNRWKAYFLVSRYTAPGLD